MPPHSRYSCLENPMDGGAWWAAVHGMAKSQTGLSNFTFPFHFHALEREMATHSSVLAWRLPGTGELQQSRTRLKWLSSSSSKIWLKATGFYYRSNSHISLYLLSLTEPVKMITF